MFAIKTLNLRKIILILITTLHLLVLKLLVYFPYPELFIYSYLTQKGLIPYRDIFDQHFPGIMFFPINLISLGFDSPHMTRFIQYGIIIMVHILLYKISKRIFKSGWYAILVNLLYFIWQPFFEGYVLWIDSIVTVFILTSFLFLLKKANKKNLFLSGLALGLSLIFKQVVIPLAGVLLFYLIFKKTKRSEILSFILGFSILPAVMLIWVLHRGILFDFIYWTITFNLTIFSEMGRKAPNSNEIVKSLLFFVPAFLGMFVTLRKKGNLGIITSIFLIGSLIFVYARFDYVHLQPALPYAVILIVYCLSSIPHSLRTKLIFFYCVISLFFVYYSMRGNFRKETLFFGKLETDLTKSIVKRVKSGDKIFAFGTTPHIYYLTNTLPPGNKFVFQFPWFMKIAEDEILSGMVSDMPKVVIEDSKSNVNGMNIVSYMPKINKFIDRYYITDEIVDGVEIKVKR